MTRVELATLYDFSIIAFDNYIPAKHWRAKIKSVSYMDYWINWLGDYSYTPSLMEHKFRTHEIIVAYQPSKLPDWSTSIMGLMFYRKYYRERNFVPKNLYVITFMERRKDFVNNGFMHSRELLPALNRRFMNYFNTFIDNRKDTVYLFEFNNEDDYLYIEDKIEKVEKEEAVDMLNQTGLRTYCCNNLYKRKIESVY